MATALPVPALDPGASRLRLSYLDGLRGLAALFVVVHHAYAEVSNELPLAAIRATQWLIYAQVAVDVFIVLSGYCLMLPVVRTPTGTLSGGPGKFYLRRARRILPPYYAALAFSLLLIVLIPGMGHPSGVRWDSSLPALTPGILLSHLFLLHCFSPVAEFKIDYPMWTVAIEWNIYLLFPIFLLPVWRRFGIVPMLAAAFGLALLAHLLHAYVYVATSWFLGLFALGMSGAALGFDARPRLAALRSRVPWGGVAALLWLAFLVTAQARESWLATHMWQTDVGVGLACVSLLLFCTRWLTGPAVGPRPVVLRLLESPGAVALGAFSYSLYLTHAPLLALLHLLLRPCRIAPLPLLAVFELVGVPLALLLAYAFHLVFERPFLPGHPRTARQAAQAAIISPAP